MHSDVRAVFDAVLNKHQSVPTMIDKLGLKEGIIENPTLEATIVNVQRQKESTLLPSGQKSIQHLMKQVSQTKHVVRTQHLSYADRVLKQQRTEESRC